jgi:hypothetical protein
MGWNRDVFFSSITGRHRGIYIASIILRVVGDYIGISTGMQRVSNYPVLQAVIEGSIRIASVIAEMQVSTEPVL